MCIVQFLNRGKKTFFTFFFTLLSFFPFSIVAADLISSSKPIIGIIQVIEHPALDQTRKGIYDELKEQGYDPEAKASISWESAQGNSALATQIAQKYIGQKASVIVAIGTIPAQSAVAAARQTMIPVIYASVTDPKKAKLEGNVTGVSNFIDVEKQLAFIQKITPNVKKIGVVFNPGEANSCYLNDMMKEVATKLGLEIITSPATKTSEVLSATQNLLGKVDAVFVNNDSTALAAFEGVTKTCQRKIPVYVSDVDIVDKGALAAVGPDQYQLGRQTGRLIVQYLKGTLDITKTPIQYPEKIDIRLNDQAAAALGIQFPKELLNNS
jgi:putative ABC transport system substrate-binding protein